jgi:hypothetical protein
MKGGRVDFPRKQGFGADIRLDLAELGDRVAARFHSARQIVGAPMSAAQQGQLSEGFLTKQPNLKSTE